LEDLFRHLLAEPLGIKHYALNTQPTGEPYMGGGQYYEPRDFLKFGQLMLDGGTWRGRRVVGADWAARAVTPHVHMGDRDYGYLWWSQEYPYRDGSVSAFYAAGNGGQIVMAMPALQLVIGFMGGNYSDPALYIPQRKYVPEYLLPAVTP
jgi:CubicO group peptidase (beta-lactamase class C family)